MINVFLGLLGFVFVGMAYLILGRKIITRRQKITLLLLGMVSFSIYLVWGLFSFGFEVGSELDLGAFQISYGTSDLLMLFLILIIPLILTINLIVSLKKITGPQGPSS